MKAKDLRKKLVNVMSEIEAGNVSPADGRNIVAAANQINVSIQNELKLMKLQIDTGKAVNQLGELSIY
tara:strand:+ start:261 stop:464 length:204 start_codon:yes stop_codon:yes gene_type:complete